MYMNIVPSTVEVPYTTVRQEALEAIGLVVRLVAMEFPHLLTSEMYAYSLSKIN